MEVPRWQRFTTHPGSSIIPTMPPPVRVRFAPSPTGHLHIGGLRTALYCHLFARKNDGSYVLRMEDTDRERSSKKYEEAILDALEWAGIRHDEGPDIGGGFGPYRQSERLPLYRKFVDALWEEGKAYPCFLSEEELTRRTEQAVKEKKAPHAYHDHYRSLSYGEGKKRIERGDSYVMRFKNHQRSWSFRDHVRRVVQFGPDMVGDFIILRSDGMPVYNLSCVVDDILMKITHVIRGEEHLPNTLRQLMLYHALGESPPEYAHVSLLVDAEGKKLSKRLGDVSVDSYRDNHYLPDALTNYLCLLGWSHPEELDIFYWKEIIPLFTPDRFNKPPAFYDIQKLNHFNGEHMRRLSNQQRVEYLAPTIEESHPFHRQSLSWKESCTELFKSKFNTPQEFLPLLDGIFECNQSLRPEYEEIKGSENAQKIAQYVLKKLEPAESFISKEEIDVWMKEIKKELNIKGKPLFKGFRAAMTLSDEGPDLKVLIPLTPINVLKKRIQIFLAV